MSFVSLILLAFAMSTDAFAAALAKGACLNRPRLSEALRTGLIFGSIEALTPLIGWLIGSVAVRYAEAWDHWVAFFLLLGLGGHMIWAGLYGEEEEECSKPSRNKFWVLALTAVATSIDALAVGLGLAFVDVNILLAAAMIGCATFTMVTIGVMAGRMVGAIIGRRAEMIGGAVLIFIGAVILYEHLFMGA